jgi:hypothetical protein
MKKLSILIIVIALIMAYYLTSWCVKYDHYEILLLNIPLVGVALCGLIGGLADKISVFLEDEN